MLEGLRKHASWLIIVIAAVFILSMAIGGITSIFIKKPVVGIIAGQRIDPNEYRELLKDAYANYAQQNPETEFDDKIAKQLNDQTWKQLVQQIILDKEVKRLHIKVNNEDVLEKLKSPPEDVTSIPQLQTDGKFDYEKYEEIIMENPEFANYMETRIRANLPYEKLYDHIKSEAEVTEEEVQQQYIDDNDKADGKIIFFDPSTIKEIEVTEENIQEYYEEHKEDYKKSPARKYKYVMIKLEASEADKKATEVKADSIYQLVIGGEDFAETAKKYSQCTSAPKGGDLGYFGKGRMVPEFEEAAFNMKTGEISKPVLTQFGWHIIKVTGKKKNDAGENEVQASHILIKNEASEETKQNMETIANDLFEKAEEENLEKAGEALAHKVEESREFYEDTPYISGIGREEEMVKFAFSKKVGTVHEPIKRDNGDYLVAEISYKVGEHYQDISELENNIKRTVEHEKKVEMITIQAEEFIKENKPESYITAAEKAEWKVIDAKDLTISKSIPGIRKDENINKAILSLEAEQYSELIINENGAYIACVTKRMLPDMEAFEADKEKLIADAQLKAETDHLNEWYKELEENANIVDNRSEFFD
ncbi:MAG: peptidylprolyl isomerase [Candidatus Cloacimonetes bacterium]|nr:peptidylprolyl isomerase [Candidatus Cloacimonadota bacterium]